MAKQFVQHGRRKVYFRVIKNGNIAAGDKVTLIHQHPQKLDVNTLLDTYYHADFINSKAILQITATIDIFSVEWKIKVSSRFAKL